MRTILLACLLGGCSSGAESAEVDAASDTIVAVDAPAAEDTAMSDSPSADSTPEDTTADTVVDTTVADTEMADAPDTGGVHYDPTVFALFSKSCATTGCHVGSTPAASLGLADVKKGYDALMGTSKAEPPKKLVVPFNPSASFLMSKLDQPVPSLTAAEKKLVATWIVDGAMY